MSKILIGRGVTNSNGVATMTENANGEPINGYTATGAGKVDFSAGCTIEERTFQSEIYEVYDTVKFDNGTIASHNDVWDYDSSTTVLTRYDEYSSITEKVSGTDARLYCKNLPTSAVVEIELCQLDGDIAQGGLNFYDETSYRQYFVLRELGYSSSIIGQWVKLQVTYGNGSLTVVSLDDPTKTVTKTYNNNITSISPSTNGGITEHRFRNLRVYNP